MWIYNNEIIEELPEDCVGFVYLITNKANSRKYVGKKLAKFSKTTYKTVKLKNGTNKISEYTAKNISKSLKGRKITWDRGVNKKVLQYDLNGNFIKEWSSIKKAALELNITPEAISNCLRKGENFSSGGFKWKYKNC